MIDIEEAQRRIDEIQSLYREWLRLLPELEAAQDEWRKAAEIVRKLDGFYSGEYNRYYTEIENGLPVSLETEGEYSIMSQDALYDAFGDHYRLSWEWMRLAVASLDPDKRSG
ncbi:hypothetical protein HMPREF9016_00619 [Neisseria sp. oral taxon 014 str. F0314]|uniref:DUF4298 domain-containing protein n=1 Tax=Neisseria TaxID=482 RepID=UPI0001D8C6E6|nr:MULTISPECIES: DUF4298 domain-containing protein [Neisseria]EFI24441.1 hypothetical protein HMPREF9016_00619 [Neisseria sp. oral taxon 014 str. F0314]